MHTQLAVAAVALLAVCLPQDADAQLRVSRSTNPLDDSTTVVAVLDAAQGAGGLFRNEPVRLIARCRSNRTEAYIVWHDYLGLDDPRVTYRFPPAQARTETWGLSTDNDSTFVRRAIPFLRTAAENTRLVVQTTPYSESPTTAIFNLAGASDALAQIAETCEWTLDREQAQRERAARQRAQAQRERAVREQREQAERAERAPRVAEVARRDVEAQRTLASFLNTPITTGLTGPIAAGDVGAVAGLRTADGYVRMLFPAASAAQLSRARRSDDYEIVCTSGGVSGSGQLELHGCSLSE